jgi:hypothetical protein
MGATTFGTTATGKNAKEAFRNAREEAQWESGHGGYSGTIAEKSDFKLVPLSEEVINDPALFASKIDELIDTEFDDKWGPAGCVQLAEHKYYFFGWASC